MREIKFRAWDTRKNKMWSPEEMGVDQLTLSPDGRGFINVNGQSTKLSTYLPHLIPEQFTGLCDDNKIEIYKGDVLRLEATDFKDKNHSWNGVVEFGNPNGTYSWGWQLRPIGEVNVNPDILLWVETELPNVRCEIIGNVHETEYVKGD
jgi:uncharacterized phage protein (TIGR01671 family)